MLKKMLVVVIVIAFGFGTGYFSTPIYNFIWPEDGAKNVKLTDVQTDTSSKAEIAGQSQTVQYISESKAINVVKGLAFIDKLKAAANTEFTIEQKPGKEYPVWLVGVKQKYPDRIPDIIYAQVDAVSGKVLDLSKAEMEISGVSLAMTRRGVEQVLGKTRKTRKYFDSKLDRNVRVDNYDGLEITYNTKNKVIKVSTQKPDFAGPRGLKTGDTRERLFQLLGRGRTGPSSLLTYVPLDDEKIQLILKLENNNLSEISLQNADIAN